MAAASNPLTPPPATNARTNTKQFIDKQYNANQTLQLLGMLATSPEEIKNAFFIPSCKLHEMIRQWASLGILFERLGISNALEGSIKALSKQDIEVRLINGQTLSLQVSEILRSLDWNTKTLANKSPGYVQSREQATRTWTAEIRMYAIAALDMSVS